MPVYALPSYLCILIALASVGAILVSVLVTITYIKLTKQDSKAPQTTPLTRLSKAGRPRTKTVYLTEQREADLRKAREEA